MPDNGIFRRPIRNTATGTGGGGSKALLVLVLVEKRPAPFWGIRAGWWLGGCLSSLFFCLLFAKLKCAQTKKKERGQHGGRKQASTGGANWENFTFVRGGGLLRRSPDGLGGDGHRGHWRPAKRVWCARPRKKKGEMAARETHHTQPRQHKAAPTITRPPSPAPVSILARAKQNAHRPSARPPRK